MDNDSDSPRTGEFATTSVVGPSREIPSPPSPTGSQRSQRRSSIVRRMSLLMNTPSKEVELEDTLALQEGKTFQVMYKGSSTRPVSLTISFRGVAVVELDTTESLGFREKFSLSLISSTFIQVPNSVIFSYMRSEWASSTHKFITTEYMEIYELLSKAMKLTRKKQRRKTFSNAPSTHDHSRYTYDGLEATGSTSKSRKIWLLRSDQPQSPFSINPGWGSCGELFSHESGDGISEVVSGGSPLTTFRGPAFIEKRSNRSSEEITRTSLTLKEPDVSPAGTHHRPISEKPSYSGLPKSLSTGFLPTATASNTANFQANPPSPSPMKVSKGDHARSQSHDPFLTAENVDPTAESLRGSLSRRYATSLYTMHPVGMSRSPAISASALTEIPPISSRTASQPFVSPGSLRSSFFSNDGIATESGSSSLRVLNRSAANSTVKLEGSYPSPQASFTTLNDCAKGTLSTSSIELRQKNIEQLLINESKEVVGGTIEQLVRALLDDSQLISYRPTFLLTYRHFTNPVRLAMTLGDQIRCAIKNDLGSTSDHAIDAENQRILKTAVCVIRDWIDGLSIAEITRLENTAAARGLLEQMESINMYPSDISMLKAVLLHKQQETRTFPERTMQDNISNQHTEIYNCSPKQFALSLSLVDAKIFRNILSEEYATYLWVTKEDQLKGNQNLDSWVQRFNKIGYWAATFVLSFTEPSQRVSAIEKLIDIAKFCNRLNNFNAVMAIVSGLNMAPVQRLKKTWTQVPLKARLKLEELEAQMSAAGNFKVYRSIEVRAKPPFIPFFGLFMKDLTFANDGNPKYLAPEAARLDFSTDFHTSEESLTFSFFRNDTWSGTRRIKAMWASGKGNASSGSSTIAATPTGLRLSNGSVVAVAQTTFFTPLESSPVNSTFAPVAVPVPVPVAVSVSQSSSPKSSISSLAVNQNLVDVSNTSLTSVNSDLPSPPAKKINFEKLRVIATLIRGMTLKQRNALVGYTALVAENGGGSPSLSSHCLNLTANEDDAELIALSKELE